jgi:hypothetical protein
MYGWPPVGKGFFWCFGKRIRCGHVSGLLRSALTAGPGGVRRRRDSKSWVRPVMGDMPDGISQPRPLTDLPSHHHMALCNSGTRIRGHGRRRSGVNSRGHSGGEARRRKPAETSSTRQSTHC